MDPSFETTPAADPSSDRENELLAECILRLKDPSDSLTWSQIKKEYGRHKISTRKVHERLRGIQKVHKRRGRPRALSERQENAIIACVETCQRMGFAKMQDQVEADLIIPMASLLDSYPFRTTPTGERKGPSKKWWRRFLRRHQDRLRLKRGSPLSYVRAMAATPRAFKSVSELLRGRMDIPENIVMMDESAVPSKCGWERRVLGTPGSSPASIPAGAIDQRHMTLVGACTAAGQMLPSVYICAGKHIMEVRMRARCRATVPCMPVRTMLDHRRRRCAGRRPKSWETDKLKHGSKFAISEHGGMTRQLFNDLLTGHIGPWLLKHGRPGPKVILIDGDGSHEPQLQTIQWLIDSDIHLFRLPAHLTHRLCPLDVSVFGPLKAYYRRLLRQKLRKGIVHVGVADRWRVMDDALQDVAPRTVAHGWEKAGLYPFNENKWKEEGWAETSAALTPKTKLAAPPAVRRSRRLQQVELGQYLLSKTPSVEEKDERIRQYVREYPIEQEILQAALPQAPALQGTRRRGRLENAEMTWLTSEVAKERAKEKEARAAEENEKALRRAEVKKTQAKMRQLIRSAEEALARETAGDSLESATASGRIDGLQSAKSMALKAVSEYEKQGVRGMSAKKAARIVRLADMRINAIVAPSGCSSPTAAHAPLRPRKGADTRVSDENRKSLCSARAENFGSGKNRPRSAGNAATMEVQAQTSEDGALASIRSLLSWRA
jgi:hypothetical protein